MTTSRKALTRFDDYREMMADEVRLDAYARAIALTVRPDDVVLDLGAGLGILSLLAARAGAKHVYAIEKGDAAELGRRIVERNGLSDRITFIQAHSFDVELPTKANVLVSETLGSFGLDESTLPFMVDARKRLLTSEPRIIPGQLVPMLAPVELPQQYAHTTFWREVRGFDFSPALQELESRMSLATVLPDNLLAAGAPFVTLDLNTVVGVAVSGRMAFTMERAGTVHGLGAWFETTLAPGVTISTAPEHAPTHWRQGFFPFRDPIDVVKGDVLEIRLRIGPADPEKRSDDTSVSYDYRCTQLAEA